MKTIKCNVDLFPWQIDVYNGVLMHPHSVHIVKSKRQVGKSVVCEMILLRYAIEKRGSTSLMVEPTLKQSRKVYNELVNAVSKTSVLKKKNDQLLELEFVNNSKILFMSAEQGETALQGWTVSGILIVDEAAYIKDTIYQALLPTTDANKAPILIVSTPRFKSGFFYDIFDTEDASVFKYDFNFYDTSALLTPERLEYYRRTLPKQKFLNYYLGEFADTGGGVFGEYKSILSNTFTKGLPCYAGIDWGTGVESDETVLSIFNSNKEQIALYHFSDKDETSTINYICDILEVLKPVKCMVETNSIGQIFKGLLQKEVTKRKIPTSVIGFCTTNDSKLKLVSAMQVAIQNKEVQLLNDPELDKQFALFESKLSSSGKLMFGGQVGVHDDIVMATLIAYHCIFNGGSYAVR